MKYRITCHRRKREYDAQKLGAYQGLDPISFNADSLEEMRACILKAQGTRFAYRVTVSCYLAAFQVLGEGDVHRPIGWQEINP